MKYPKPIMTINELVAMGYSKHLLRNLYAEYGYPLAFKEIPSKTALIKFDTEELDKTIKRLNKR